MITRFAPSPTGPLHLGHAFSAITAHDLARAEGGRFLLRIEDIDQSRSRPEWERQIFEDLAWLGISWDGPVVRQSERLADYRAAIADLWDRGLLFACRCNRRDILDASAAPQEGAPLIGPDGIVYPGTCRARKRSEDLPIIPEGMALRLDMRAALDTVDIPEFIEHLFQVADAPRRASLSRDAMIDTVGDVVVARRDMGTSYHLSVVIDDASEEITDVVRGEDLFDATFIHVILQRLLGYPTPQYHHHRLIRDDAGKRLAKRDDARAIRLYRESGASPADIRAMIGI